MYRIEYEVPDNFHLISLYHYSHLGFSAHVVYNGAGPYFGTNKSCKGYQPAPQTAINLAVQACLDHIAADQARPKGPPPVFKREPPVINLDGLDLGEIDI